MTENSKIGRNIRLTLIRRVALAVFIGLLSYTTYRLHRFIDRPISIKINLSHPAEQICFAALGDTGSGDSNQARVSEALQGAFRQSPFEMVLLLGDQFYGSGVTDKLDPQWQTKFEDMYPFSKLPINFYAVLGNHDYDGNIWASIDRSDISTRWSSPGRFYTFTYSLPSGETIQFFALDSAALTRWHRRLDSQLSWLESELEESSANWKIVFGHHPVVTDGKHRESRHVVAMNDQLKPLLQRFGVQLYMSGHDHNLQFIDAGEGLFQLISGGGGAKLHEVMPSAHSLFAASQFGFTLLCAGKEKLDIKIYSDTQELLFNKSLDAKPTSQPKLARRG